MRTPVFSTMTLLFALSANACVSGQSHVDMTSTELVSFGTPAPSTAAAGAPVNSLFTESDLQLDWHDDIAEASKAGTLSLSGLSETLSGIDLTTVQTVTVTIGTLDGTMPTQVLAGANVPPGSIVLELPRQISDPELLAYLAEGPVVLDITLSGAALPQTPTLTHSIAVTSDVSVAGSVGSL